jgi:hypothetical protein
MLQEQVIPIEFGQGVDTKTDPKAVVAGKFIRLENGVFTTSQRISKRNGYTALNSTIAAIGSLASPQMTHAYNNELIAQDQNRLLSYSPSQTAWMNKGPYTSVELTKNSIDQEHPSSGIVDSAILGNYALYAWSTARQTSSSGLDVVPTTIFAAVIDLQTGVNLTGNTEIVSYSTTDIGYVRCVLMAGTTLGLFYGNQGLTNIQCRTVSFAGSGIVSFTAGSSVSTDFQPNNFDAVGTTAGASLLYQTSTGLTIANITTSRTVSGTVAITDTIPNKTVSCLLISKNSSNDSLWVYWTVQTNATSDLLKYAVFTSALVPVLAKTTIITLLDPDYVSNVISFTNSATQQTIFYGITRAISTSPSGLTASFDYTRYATVTSAGVVDDNFFVNGVSPFSKSLVVTFNSTTCHYAVFLYRGLSARIGASLVQEQPTFFLIRIDIVAPFAASDIIPQVTARFASAIASCELASTVKISYSPNIASISATKFLFPCGVDTQSFQGDYFQGINTPPELGLAGSFAYYIDYQSQNANKATNCGEIAILNGGVIQMYDGNSCTEWGFHLFPEIAKIDQATPMGGAIPAGTYSYIAIYQWTDAQGNLHQSTPSESMNVVVSSASSSTTIYVTPILLSQKQGASIAIYRTIKDGSVYFLVTDPVFLLSGQPSSIFTVSFTDNLTDTQIQGNPQAYTYPASSVLENSTPPPSMVMVAHTNRLWFLNDENRNEIWYTKSFSQGTGLSPSALLLDEIDPKLGDIVGLGEMDEKLVIGKSSGFVIQAGDGANDTGNGSTLSFPQFVPSDVGISQMKSLITIPSGVMFKSLNGIYILDRKLNIGYIGNEVEAYNSQVITSANLVPGKTQIRFLCSTGLTLVYDYIFNQWSTFTAHTGVSATNWNSTYVYSTGTAVLQEASGTYTDNGSAFSLLAQTSWLGLAGIQGFQRVKRLIMLGDFTNGNSALHNLSIAAAYDFSTTFQSAITYAFGAASASGVFQYRERLPIQKCDTISLLIQETTTGSALEYIDLTNISFEAGVKRGVNKLRGQQSVG